MDADETSLEKLIEFLQRLTRSLNDARSVADAFDAAFIELADRTSTSVAMGVMLEQNLNVYLAKNPAADVSDEELRNMLRESLLETIHVDFDTSEAAVVSHETSLGGEYHPGPLAYKARTILEIKGTIAGVISLYRSSAPFDELDDRLLEVVSSILSIVISSIDAGDRIQQLADMDDMTGIGNKRSFKKRIISEVDRAHGYRVPLSLMMFDIDDFKEINDIHGHPIGDVVLSELCGCVKETLRPTDFFARFGGDEFAIILPHTDHAGAASAADRVMERVTALRIPAENGTFVKPTISLGAATLLPEEDYRSLLKRADQLLYDSKRAGKARSTV